MNRASAATQAVVLSGGGANGASKLGVLQALFAGKVRALGGGPVLPEIFTGTSIGSFNAAYLAGQWDVYGAASAGKLEEIWLDRLCQNPTRPGNGAYRIRALPTELLQPYAYLPNPLRPWAQLAGDSAHLAWDGLQRAVHLTTARDETLPQRLSELFNFTSFVSTEPWEQTIRSAVPFEAIRRSTRLLRIAATNWTTGELRIFGNLDMTDKMGPLAILASSAIPGVFPEVYVGAEPHVDGGVLMNTPLKLATDAGADVLHVIYLDPDVRSVPLDDLQSTLGTVYRQQLISWAKVVNDDIEDAASINHALSILERIRRDEEVSEEALRPLARSLHRVWHKLRLAEKYRPLTIHRYHPRDDLSNGALGLLNLDRGHIENLIERGFSDAVNHDCKASRCILPAAAGFSSERGDDEV